MALKIDIPNLPAQGNIVIEGVRYTYQIFVFDNVVNQNWIIAQLIEQTHTDQVTSRASE